MTSLEKTPQKLLRTRLVKLSKQSKVMKQLLKIKRVEKIFANLKINRWKKEKKLIESELKRRSGLLLTHKPFYDLARIMKDK